MSQNRKIERSIEQMKNRFWRAFKQVSWRHRPKSQTRVLWIFGCQRSGTTLLCRLLERDKRTLVLHEDSIITQTGEQRLRLQEQSQLASVLANIRHPIVVAKPLVESQHATEILNAFPDSRAIWLWRDYRDLVNSHVRRFKNQIQFIQAIVHRDSEKWGAEAVSDEVVNVIQPFVRDDMPREDAAALIWFARNQLYFDQPLADHPRVQIMKYEDLIQEPNLLIESIYDLLGMTPHHFATGVVDSRSLNHGKQMKIDPRIEDICQQMQTELAQASQATEGVGQRA